MALTADALITWEFAKTMLDLEDADQSYTEALINAASVQANNVTGRKLKARNLTEYISGNGGRALIVQSRPIVSVTSLYLDASRVFGEDTKTTDYVLDGDAGVIYLTTQGAPYGIHTVKIVYVGGYGQSPATVPEDLQQAILEVVMQNFTKLRSRGIGVRQASGPDGMNTSYEMAIPFNALRILTAYRDPRIA